MRHSEQVQAILVANKVLDMPGRDPDDDLSMMSRQFLRSQERVAEMSKCLAFFSSVIKSGEPWTEDCETAYRKAVGYPAT